jgi:ABC-type bacteriocin/lantibiotic exporter with double-glycine peptidase domain
MVAKHYGKSYSIETLRDWSYITREGVSLLGTNEAAESIGLGDLGTKMRQLSFYKSLLFVFTLAIVLKFFQFL